MRTLQCRLELAQKRKLLSLKWDYASIAYCGFSRHFGRNGTLVAFGAKRTPAARQDRLHRLANDPKQADAKSMSPEMVAVARERIEQEGWRNVSVVQSSAEDAQIAETADAALFCAVHDIMQSPDALRNVLGKLRPGAEVAAGGGKWAAPWMVALNLPVTMPHSPYVRSFEGFERPWHHLEQLLEDVHVRELGLGSGYIMTGQVPSRTQPAALAH